MPYLQESTYRDPILIQRLKGSTNTNLSSFYEYRLLYASSIDLLDKSSSHCFWLIQYHVCNLWMVIGLLVTVLWPHFVIYRLYMGGGGGVSLLLRVCAHANVDSLRTKQQQNKTFWLFSAKNSLKRNKEKHKHNTKLRKTAPGGKVSCRKCSYAPPKKKRKYG